jgi:hypothetical protein
MRRGRKRTLKKDKINERTKKGEKQRSNGKMKLVRIKEERDKRKVIKEFPDRIKKRKFEKKI